MIKAPLDEKNISPSQIIDDLTCCNNINKDCMAVGFIDDIPVIFDYKTDDNEMNVTCRDMRDTDKLRERILNYIVDTEKSDERILARFYTHEHSFVLRFWWKEEGDVKY